MRHRSGRWVATTLRYLMARDDRRCGRCVERIDPKLPGTHPDGATIGHVVALSLGGTDNLENLRPEHRRCNLAAGAGPEAAPTPTIVEAPRFFDGQPAPGNDPAARNGAQLGRVRTGTDR